MMTWTVPFWLYTETLPPVPILTTTRFGTVCPAEKFRLDVGGRPTPDGQTVRKLPCVPWVTVVLTMMPDAVAGTSPTVTSTLVPAGAVPTAPVGVPCGPVRVSSTRAGVIGERRSPLAA